MEELSAEVKRGCEQVRQFDEKLQAVIDSPNMYPGLITEAASIISTFVSVISHLNRGASRSSNPPAPPAPSRPRVQVPNTNSSPMDCSPVPHPTPPHSPSPPHTTTACTTSSSSPALTPSTTPVGSPSIPSFSLEQTSSDPDDPSFHDTQPWRSNRKRKCMPKKTVKMPANISEQGTETPTDDGHTWRKYGQKDILNSKFPRSYYRCTHQKELGCQATKYVQKCEDEASMYQVTYIGEHTCQGGTGPTGVLWNSPSGAARPLFESIQQQQQQQPPLLGALQSSIFLSSRLEDMKAARLSLSPSRASGFNLLRPHGGVLTSPSQWATPKFGGLACPIKAEPAAPPPQLATSQQESRVGEMRQREPRIGLTNQESSSVPELAPHGTAGGSELHEIWNLEELAPVDTSVSAGLEHMPKVSLSEDISISTFMLGEYEATGNSDSYEPMLFDTSHQQP